mmetsp:Transcript_13255/g.33817  ORF Transcript_13255/g.33817 Transcript_13255/m.33817 type:complete len:375 (-) Transcript_13255:110-1234(-)
MKQRERRKNKKGSRLHEDGDVEVRAEVDPERLSESPVKLAASEPSLVSAALVSDSDERDPDDGGLCADGGEPEAICPQCASVNAFPFNVRLVACYQCQAEVSLDLHHVSSHDPFLDEEERIATCAACGNDNLFPLGVDLVACHHCEQPVLLRVVVSQQPTTTTTATTTATQQKKKQLQQQSQMNSSRVTNSIVGGTHSSSFAHTLEPSADDDEYDGSLYSVPVDDDRFAAYSASADRRVGGGASSNRSFAAAATSGGVGAGRYRYDDDEEEEVVEQADNELYRERLMEEEEEVCLPAQGDSEASRRHAMTPRDHGDDEEDRLNEGEEDSEEDEEEDDEDVFECPECQAPNVFPPGTNAVLCWSCREAISMNYYG